MNPYAILAIWVVLGTFVAWAIVHGGNQHERDLEAQRAHHDRFDEEERGEWE